MRKFNIRKVLDGLTAGSSSASQQQQQQQHPPGNREPEIQETLQSEHFQLCKVSAAGKLRSLFVFFFFWGGVTQAVPGSAKAEIPNNGRGSD
jgi:hypothetical protein